MKTNYKNNLESVPHKDVQEGDVVYIDNYQDGQSPHASPLISGPYRKARGNGCGRWLERIDNGRGFMFYPERLLRPITTAQES